MSVVLIPANPTDVVPRRGLVADEALVNACRRLSRRRLRHHAEVLHVVTRRRPVALYAFDRSWRRMLEFGDHPRLGRMAGGAVAAEQLLMAIPGPVARRTFKAGLPRSHEWVKWVATRLLMGTDPREYATARRILLVALESCESDLRQRLVIHRRRTDRRPAMLDVTGGARADVCVKRRRLSLEQRTRASVTTDTLQLV